MFLVLDFEAIGNLSMHAKQNWDSSLIRYWENSTTPVFSVTFFSQLRARVVIALLEGAWLAGIHPFRKVSLLWVVTVGLQFFITACVIVAYIQQKPGSCFPNETMVHSSRLSSACLFVPCTHHKNTTYGSQSEIHSHPLIPKITNKLPAFRFFTSSHCYPTQ